MVNFSSQTAYLLHRRPYQENKLLVELLTENEGKITAITYTGQSKKSNKKALLQPFLPIQVDYKGKNSLKSLSRVEAFSKSHHLIGRTLYCGLYLNELLVKLLPDELPCFHLYQHYINSIKQLSDGHAIEPLLRKFEMALLVELGLALDFSQAASYRSDYVTFNFDQGFEPALKSEQSFFTQDVLALGQGAFHQPVVLNTAKRLMRYIINQLLGNQPLNSRMLFEKRE